MISFLKRYLRKFKYAFGGLSYGIRKDKSIALQCLLGVGVLMAFACFELTMMEWCLIWILVGGVIALEFVNSAIETIVDFISPQYHEKAKIMKDYAAAAVLVFSIAAAIVGILIVKGHIG